MGGGFLSPGPGTGRRGDVSAGQRVRRISAAKGPAGRGAVGGEERILFAVCGYGEHWGRGVGGRGLGAAFRERKRVWARACEGRGGLGVA